MSVCPLSVVKTLMIASVPSTPVSFVAREMATFLAMGLGVGMACTIPKTERATRAMREKNMARRVEEVVEENVRSVE